MNKDLFEAIGDKARQRVLCSLFDVSIDTKNLMVSNQLRKVIKHVSQHM